MRVCYSGLHYCPTALGGTLSVTCRKVGLLSANHSPPLWPSLDKYAQHIPVRKTSCPTRYRPNDPSGTWGGFFISAVFSLDSHRQRLLPHPAHDITNKRTDEEHIYNTAEWGHRQRHTEKGIITPNVPRLQFLFPYTLATVTSFSLSATHVYDGITDRHDGRISISVSYPGDPRFKYRPQDRLSLLLHSFLRYDQINVGKVPHIKPPPCPSTSFHCIVWH
jgi:hypothetical protein